MDSEKELYKSVIQTYLGADFLEQIEKYKEKVLLPGGQKITGHLLQFEINHLSAFSSQCELLDLFEFLYKYSDIVITRILKCGGFISEIKASTIYAYYNNTNNPDQIIEMINDIIYDFKHYIDNYENASKYNLSLIISYHIGSVLLVTLGCKGKLQRVVMGIEHNILEKLSIVKKDNRDGKILITDTVFKSLTQKNRFSKVDEFRIVGMKDEVIIYEYNN